MKIKVQEIKIKLSFAELKELHKILGKLQPNYCADKGINKTLSNKMYNEIDKFLNGE